MKIGKYNFLYTDTFYKVAVVYEKTRGIVAINKAGRILYNVHLFDNGPDYESGGLYRIYRRNKFGFANSRGVAIKPRFSFVFQFSEGYAVFVMSCTFKQAGEHTAVVGGKWGYIDRNGKIVQPAIYDKAGDFTNGRAVVEYNGQEILVDRNFKEVRE